jgi:hypothetical protein
MRRVYILPVVFAQRYNVPGGISHMHIPTERKRVTRVNTENAC